MLNQRGTNGNNIFPSFMENNMFPQLQLFGHVRPGDQIPVENAAPISRAEVSDTFCIQHKLPLSNNIFYPNPTESLRIGSVLNHHHHHHVSTGLKLSYEEDERNSTLTSPVVNTTPLRFPLENAVKTELNRQTEEFNQFIKLQEQNIVKGVQEMNQRHTVSFLNTLEKHINQKLHEKDIEIDNMNKKNRELADQIKQIAIQAQSWHSKAIYNESIANTLKINIQKLIGQTHEGSGESEIDDAVSFSNNPKGSMTCRSCSTKEVSVLIMPCRHLCLCSDCEGFVEICPVCRMMKTGSLHVYM